MEEELANPSVEYDTMKTSDTIIGDANYIIDNRGYVFLIIANPDYEQRHCRSLLTQLRTEFYKKYPLAEKGEVKFIESSFIDELAIKMNDPTKFDVIAQANKKIGVIKEKIQSELKEVVSSQKDMNVIISQI